MRFLVDLIIFGYCEKKKGEGWDVVRVVPAHLMESLRVAKIMAVAKLEDVIN